MIYKVEWTEDLFCWAYVEADSLEEAKEKFEFGKTIPDSEDTEPGNGKRRKVRFTEEEDTVFIRRN